MDSKNLHSFYKKSFLYFFSYIRFPWFILIQKKEKKNSRENTFSTKVFVSLTVILFIFSLRLLTQKCLLFYFGVIYFFLHFFSSFRSGSKYKSNIMLLSIWTYRYSTAVKNTNLILNCSYVCFSFGQARCGLWLSSILFVQVF